MTYAIPTFTTARLILRGVSIDDEPAYIKHFVNYAVISQLSATIPWPYPADGVSQYLRQHILPRQGVDQWVWGLFLKNNPSELIGAVGLWRQGCPEHRGFWLGQPFWGQGYMTEAVIPITDHAFDTLGFETLIFANACGNQRSRCIKEKTGATWLYTQPKEYVDPAYKEQEVWQLTQEAWKNLAKDV